MAISTNGTVLTRLAGALYNTQMSNATYKEVASLDPTALANVLYARDFNTVSDATVATTLVANLGLTSVAGLTNWVAAQLTAAGSNKGAKVVDLLNGFAQLTSDATYGAFATAFNTKVDTALALSQTADNTGGTFTNISTAVSGKTFALTTSTNTQNGTAGNDTFDAGLSATSLQTLNSGDQVFGGEGTDEMFAVINSSVTPTALSSVENVTVTVVTNNSTLDLTNSTGLVNLTSAGATAVPTIAGISKAVNVTLRDSAQAHTITYSDVSGSTDAATVNVSNLSQATGVVTSIAGIETLTINATGGDSAIGTLTSANTSALNLTGTKALNIVDNLGTTVLTVNASANTGGVNLDFNGTNMSVTGGTGNDDFSFEAAGNVSVDGGAGNDTIRFDATGTLTSSDTVNGGDGVDTLNARSEELDDFTALPTTFRITNVERVTANTAVLNGATINLPFISDSANRLTLTAANAGTSTLNFNAGASTLVNAAASVGAIAVDAAGTALTDSLTISNSGASSVDSLNGQNLTSTDFETLTITTTGTGAAGNQSVGAISVTASTGGTPSLVINGSNQLTTGVITATGGSISASGMTASTTGLIMVTGQNTATRITGSPVADTLFGAITSAVSQTIDGGAGNDAITAGSGNDVITGGDGVDTIDGGAGNDNIDGGAGNDRIVISANANLTDADTVTGGSDTDTLAFTAAITDAASTFQALSGFEVLELAPAAASSLTMSNFINNQTFTRIDFGNAANNTMTTNNVGVAVTDIRLIEGVTGDTVVFDRLVDNTTNAVAISARNTTAQTITAATIDDEEFVTYSSVNAAADVTITTLNAADLLTLTVSGDGDLIVTNAITSTLVRSVDASTSTGAVTVVASNAVVSVTANGGSGVFTFTGGALADNITGGSGADILNGGGGADIINAGLGNDLITGATGADVINVGSGTDTLAFTADGNTGTLTSLAGAISLTGVDVVTGMGNGDTIRLSGLGYSTGAGAVDGSGFVIAFSTSTLATNAGVVLRGSWIAGATTGSGTFIGNAAGTDTLFVVDADQATATTSYEAIVLVGTVATAATAATDSGNVTVTLTV